MRVKRARVYFVPTLHLTKASSKTISKYSLDFDVVLLTSFHVIYIRLRILPTDPS
jgi:hypothetical protein